MAKRPKIRVDASRTVNTYAELWHASRTLCNIATNTEQGSTWTSMASILLTAFTFEAFLNHLGARLFKAWADMESLSPQQKFAVLSERLHVSYSPASRPGQTVRLLVRFRNALAHGKTEQLSSSKVVSADFLDRSVRSDRPMAEWERLCTPAFALRARADVEKIITRMHKAAKIKDESPFMFGVNIRNASLEPVA